MFKKLDRGNKELDGFVREIKERRQQAGAGPGIATVIDLGKRAAGSKLGKMMINDAIDYIPTAYKKN